MPCDTCATRYIPFGRRGRRGTSETETKILRGRRNEGSREKKEEGKRERGIEAGCKSSGNEAPSSRGLTDLFDVHGPTCLPTCLSTYLPTYLSTYCTYVHVYVYASNNAHMQKAHHRPPLCVYLPSFSPLSLISALSSSAIFTSYCGTIRASDAQRAQRGIEEDNIATNDFSRGKTCY